MKMKQKILNMICTLRTNLMNQKLLHDFIVEEHIKNALKEICSLGYGRINEIVVNQITVG